MLDIKYILEHQADIEQAIKAKNVSLSLADLLSIHKKRGEMQQQIETLNRQRNENANRTKGQVGKPSDGMIQEGKRIKAELEQLTPKFDVLDQKFSELLLKVPNVYSPDTPIGPDDSANVELRQHGEPTQFDFDIQDHITLGLKHNLFLEILHNQYNH